MAMPCGRVAGSLITVSLAGEDFLITEDAHEFHSS